MNHSPDDLGQPHNSPCPDEAKYHHPSVELQAFWLYQGDLSCFFMERVPTRVLQAAMDLLLAFGHGLFPFFCCFFASSRLAQASCRQLGEQYLFTTTKGLIFLPHVPQVNSSDISPPYVRSTYSRLDPVAELASDSTSR